MINYRLCDILEKIYTDYKQALIDYTKKYYGDIFLGLDDASVASWMIDINADVEIVSTSGSRAGAKFVNLDSATANQILFLNMILDDVNKFSNVF